MKNYLKRLLVAVLIGVGLFGGAAFALATANTWHLNLRNGDDTGDVIYDLDRPSLGLGFHVLVFDPNTTYPSWFNLTRFKDEILDPWYGFISTSTYNPQIASLQSQINALAGSGVGFNVATFMANSASTTPYIATATTTGFMSGPMVFKLNAMSTSTATATTSGFMSAADKARLDSISTTSATVSYTNRSLNTCFQVSTTKDAFVAYSVDVDTSISLAGGANGQVALRTYSDSSCTTDGQTIQRGKAGLTGTVVIGLAMNNPSTVSLGGIITRGRYGKLETSNLVGTPTYTMVATQEVTGFLVQQPIHLAPYS